MIKNVVFDFGQVLVRFEPEYMTGQYIKDENDIKLMSQVLFDRLYWDKLDKGTISDEEVVALSNERLPEHLREKTAKVYYNWIYNIPQISGMEEIAKELKEKGVRIFLLSNISTYFAAHAKEISVLSHFEKCIFSAVCGHTKPNADMFDHLCKKCGIDPSETLFVDDSEKNISGAENFGIKGYLFDGDAGKLRRYLEKIGIL